MKSIFLWIALLVCFVFGFVQADPHPVFPGIPSNIKFKVPRMHTSQKSTCTGGGATQPDKQEEAKAYFEL